MGSPRIRPGRIVAYRTQSGLIAPQALRGIDSNGGTARAMRILPQHAHIFRRRNVFILWWILRSLTCVDAAHDGRGIRINEERRRYTRTVAGVQRPMKGRTIQVVGPPRHTFPTLTTKVHSFGVTSIHSPAELRACNPPLRSCSSTVKAV